VSRYHHGKTNLDFTEARDSKWQWHQLGHMQVCTLLQTDNHASNPPLGFLTGRMPFLSPNQQRQSTEDKGTEGRNVKQKHTQPTTLTFSMRHSQPQGSSYLNVVLTTVRHHHLYTVEHMQQH